VELSRELLDPTRGLGRLGVARLSLCALLRIVGLLALETQQAIHTAGSSSDCLGTALLLAALASAMRLAMLRAASLSCLGAAHVLAASAPAVRNAVLRVALSSSEAALMLAPLASAMRLAGARVASSRLEAALLLAALAPAMRPAVWRAPPNS
jgi:hypothetical protein